MYQKNHILSPVVAEKKIQVTLCFLKILQEMLEEGNFMHSN